MKLLAVMILGYNKSIDKVLILSREKNLESFGMFIRGKVHDAFKKLARESFHQFKAGTRHTVKHNEYLAHIIKHEDTSA